jgi:hypothetical protein
MKVWVVSYVTNSDKGPYLFYQGVFSQREKAAEHLCDFIHPNYVSGLWQDEDRRHFAAELVNNDILELQELTVMD